MEFDTAYANISRQIHYSGNNLTFNKWMKKPDDLKAAFLFINFYKEIKNARFKAIKMKWVDECKVLSTLFQYLDKNVYRIKDDPKRYTAAYIYQVSYNCMKSTNWDKSAENIYNKEVSLTVQINDSEFDVCDMLLDVVSEVPGVLSGIDQFDIVYDYVPDVFVIIRRLGPEYEKLAYSLITSQGLRRVSKSNKNRVYNPFSEVSVSKNDIPHMMKVLKYVISEYVIRYDREDLMKFIE